MFKVENGSADLAPFIEAAYQQLFPDVNLSQASTERIASLLYPNNSQDTEEELVNEDANSEPDAIQAPTQKQSRRSSGHKAFRASQHPDFPRPYPCNICGKRFILAHHLVSHSITHTGLRPYSCHLCESRFTQVSSLKRHQYKIHNMSQAEAARVPQVHVQLNRPVVKTEAAPEVVHTGRRRPVCATCGKSFKTKFTLTRHQPICPGTLLKRSLSNVTSGGSEDLGSGALNSSAGMSSPSTSEHFSGTLEQDGPLIGQKNARELINAMEFVNSSLLTPNISPRLVRDRTGFDNLHADLNESDYDDVEQNAFDHSSNENDLTEIDSLVVDALKECSKSSGNLSAAIAGSLDANQLRQADINMLNILRTGNLNLAEPNSNQGQQVLPSVRTFEQTLKRSSSLWSSQGDDITESGNNNIQTSSTNFSYQQPNAASTTLGDAAALDPQQLIADQAAKRSGGRRRGTGGKRVCPEDSPDRPYRCPECNWSFRLHHHLTNHMSVHSGARPYTCNSCSRAFSQVSSLKRHVDNHCPAAATNNEAAFLGCVMCERKFNNTRALKQHVKIDHHLNEAGDQM